MSQQLIPWQATLEAECPEPSLRRVAIAAGLTIAIGFGGFTTWAATAPLDSAVPAMGMVVVAGKHQTISLLDSGILQELLVHEGDHVALGQPLLRLDETQAKSQLTQATAQRWALLSRLARLQAEQSDGEMVLPADLTAAAGQDPALSELVHNEQRLFAVRRQTLRGSLASQETRSAELNQEIAALNAQKGSTETQLAILTDHLKGMRELLAKGFAPRNQVLDLQGQQAGLQGSLRELEARKAQARENIAQAQLELIRMRDSWQSDVGRDLQDAHAQLADVTARILAADDTLKRKLVTAPEAGTVTDVKFVTTGSSIGAGQPILDIVPHDDQLLIEANVAPTDIEHVHAGQRVNVRLTSYKQHKVPVLTGHLTYVSADRQTDAHGDPYFLARAELDPGTLEGLKNVRLFPGMPAEVLIIGGERVALDYFLSPITESVHRSLHEE